MESKLAVTAASPVAAVVPSPAPPAPASNAQRMQDDVADLRLVIEEDRGLFIYKTVDRRTGDVVQVLPREEVVRTHDATAYAANAALTGAVIDTSA